MTLVLIDAPTAQKALLANGTNQASMCSEPLLIDHPVSSLSMARLSSATNCTYRPQHAKDQARILYPAHFANGVITAISCWTACLEGLTMAYEPEWLTNICWKVEVGSVPA
jgi:hypothetical protein